MCVKVNTFDIWGCCISRDSFGIPSIDGGGDAYGDNYKINYYFQDCSPLVQFSSHVGPNIYIEDLSDDIYSRKKHIASNYNKDIDLILGKSSSEWLILDTRVFSYDICILKFPDGSVELINEKAQMPVVEALKKKGVTVDVMPVNPMVFNFEVEFEKFINFISNRYGEKIILIESREAYIKIDEYGIFKGFDWDIDRYSISMTYTSKILSRLKCFFIKTPCNTIADALHKWNFGAVHFVSEYYYYVRDAIEIVVSGVNRLDVLNSLEILYVNCCSLMLKILRGEVHTINNTIQRSILNLKTGDVENGLSLLNEMVVRDVPVAYAWMGRIYKDGIGVDVDLTVSSNWMREAVKKNVSWARNELFDILWNINTPESLDEMIHVATDAAERGDGAAMGRLGRAYRDGRGVPCDLTVAADWFSRALMINKYWEKELKEVLILR